MAPWQKNRVGQSKRYGNIKTVDASGIKHDSRHEQKVWRDLKMRQLAGEITNLERQVQYYFEEGERSVKYASGRRMWMKPDFRYKENGRLVVADAKSEATREKESYKIKKALMDYFYGIKILEL